MLGKSSRSTPCHGISKGGKGDGEMGEGVGRKGSKFLARTYYEVALVALVE